MNKFYLWIHWCTSIYWIIETLSWCNILIKCLCFPKPFTTTKDLQPTLEQLVVKDAKYKAKKLRLFKTELKHFEEKLARDVSLFDPNNTKTVIQLLKKMY